MIELDALWKTGKDFLGTRYPIIAGAMTWISDSHFTAEVSEAGAFGSLAAPPSRSLSASHRWLRRRVGQPIVAPLQGPFFPLALGWKSCL